MRIIFTGPPSSGKTTLLRSPELNTKFDIFPEVARDVLTRSPHLKGNNLNHQIENIQLNDWGDATSKVRHCIYDRGLPDQIAYRQYFGIDVPNELYNLCENKRYDLVFYLPFWDEIYEQDHIRKDTSEEAKEIGIHIKFTYQILGYP